MKIGIYISGLGQSFVNESVEKYAERLKNEINFNTTGTKYEIKTDKVKYTADQYSTIVSICEKTEQSKVVYKFYDFKYNEILTEKFNSYSLIVKNLWLFLLIVRKLPLIIKRLFSPASYNRPFQTLYLFLILLIIACTILLALPATFGLIISFLGDLKFIEVFGNRPLNINSELRTVAEIVASVIALFLLILPNANILIVDLATEFVCANNYMQYGAQKQLVQGNLELLIEYISETEKDCKIHFHAYSFGSILAIDYIYPFGNKASTNTGLYCEAIITIGTPFEFVNSYYPNFYQNRDTELGEKFHWINIYSIADALATNFRKDSQIGDAEFGITKDTKKPTNINYEVAPINKGSIPDFILLNSIKVHGMYWDSKTEGQSCLRLIYDEMNKRNLI